MTLEDQREALARLHGYLTSAGVPDSHLSPGWLARRLGVEERELLGTLAHAVREGLVELHWEVWCPGCGISVEEFESLREARALSECAPCGLHFDLHLDRDVRVTFSASERVRRERGTGHGSEPLRLDQEGAATATTITTAPTRGLDLLLVPAFRELFSGEAPAADESLRIGRVAILFTDLRGSTAMYAERGDPLAYRLVRDHFAILAESIERNRGAFIKTIGDAVMASFASGADAVRAALEAQMELHARAVAMGGELIVKAGVHAGACLSVRLNERLDFFGGAVNTAARVQGLSHGDDVVVTDAVMADLEAEPDPPSFQIAESFDAELRGLPAPVHVHRLR
ncbi:MAG TPA: adenylate/guanylate cyclase domain-containing protein [Pyrinomonadaceae bacterium]|jgi:class 3 adenylate cyclase|nr:adenylate/guanylate cyclase domain-containing protein [Pyrinomonadaceae bacterium]